MAHSETLNIQTIVDTKRSWAVCGDLGMSKETGSHLSSPLLAGEALKNLLTCSLDTGSFSCFL